MITILSSEFSWEQFLFGSEDYVFLLEIVFRTLIMFLTIVVGLRVLGKRGVKQLSIFELVVIVGLGSAAGDPMFYKEVGIVSSMLVFAVIIVSYSLLTYLIGRYKKIENLLEGKPSCLIQDGVFALDNFKKENLGSDEFFSELRLKGISQLGQIEMAIEETSGDISVFYYEDENVKYGLPIMLRSLENPIQHFYANGFYSCTFCGFSVEKKVNDENKCSVCAKKNWVSASNKRRIT